MEGHKTIIEPAAMNDTIVTTVRMADRSIRKEIKTTIVTAKIIAMRRQTNRDSKYYTKVE
jgi:hypothetical protein